MTVGELIWELERFQRHCEVEFFEAGYGREALVRLDSPSIELLEGRIALKMPLAASKPR